MEVVRQRDHGAFRPRHDATRILPLFRLSVEVRHGAGVAVREPAVQLRRVRIALEARYTGRSEPQRRCSTLYLDGVCDFHSPIVSRRHRAKFTTLPTAGTARSSPYAVNMRHCM